jgi:hypothetical protein
MPFDAFLQYIQPDSNAPKVVGEDAVPAQVPPSEVQEVPGDIQAAGAQASPAVDLNQEATSEIKAPIETQ